jgi:AraC-like DNA-binding protein
MAAPAVAPSTPLRFSTETLAPGERVAAWREVYGRTVAKLEFEPVSPAPVVIEATLRNLPGVGIATLATEGLRFAKPSSLIDSDDLILVTVESGRYSGWQLGREVDLAPGDAVIRWNAEVARGEIVGQPSIIRVPTKAIAPLVGDISAAVQRRIPADSEALRLLRPYLRMLQHNPATPGLQQLAASHMHDLIALLLGSTREAAEIARGRGVRAARLRAIKGDIATRLADAELSAASVAQRHRLSPRYLHRLFEEDGLTFSEYVTRLRLTRAQRLLADPRYAGHSISTIAYDVGFGDLSYFFRTFRRRFGARPSDMRAADRKALK